MNNLLKDINYEGKKDNEIIKRFKINKNSKNLLYILNVIDDLNIFINDFKNLIEKYDNILICLDKNNFFMEKQILLDYLYFNIELIYLKEFNEKSYYFIYFKKGQTTNKYINVNNIDYILEFFNRYNLLVKNNFNSTIDTHSSFFEYLFEKYKEKVEQDNFLELLEEFYYYNRKSVKKSIKIMLEYIDNLEKNKKINVKELNNITNKYTKYSDDKFLNLFVEIYKFYIYLDGDNKCKYLYNSNKNIINLNCDDLNRCDVCKNTKIKGYKYDKLYIDIHTRKKDFKYIFKPAFHLKKHVLIKNKVYQNFFVINNLYFIDKIFKLININSLLGGNKNNFFFDLINNSNYKSITNQLVFFNDKLHQYINNNNLQNNIYQNTPKLLKLIKERVIDLEKILSSKKQKLNPSIYTEKNLFVNGTIKHIFDNFNKPFTKNNKIIYHDNKPLKLSSNIRIDEGNILFYLIKNIFPNEKLIVIEIGFAHGISALFIGEGIRKRYDNNWFKHNPNNDKIPLIHPDGSRHIIIDPFQFNNEHKWKGIGYQHMLNAELPIDLKTNPDYIELPKLIFQDNLNNKCHVMFIDGSHRFDYTLMNLFMADKLIKLNGYIIIDDGQMEIVRDAINYFITHYLHYEITNIVHNNMVFLKKVSVGNYKSSRDLSDYFRSIIKL